MTTEQLYQVAANGREAVADYVREQVCDLNPEAREEALERTFRCAMQAQTELREQAEELAFADKQTSVIEEEIERLEIVLDALRRIQN
jgi:hypothetical protein